MLSLSNEIHSLKVFIMAKWITLFICGIRPAPPDKYQNWKLMKTKVSFHA